MSEGPSGDRPIAVVEAELPSGRKVKLREPTGDDELKAQADAGTNPSPLLLAWSQIMRSLMETHGGKETDKWEAVDQTRLTPTILRGMFSSKDMAHLRILFMETFYVPSDEEETRFQGSKRLGVL